MPSNTTTKKESNGSDVILVKQDDEFYKKLMSKELTNAPTPSFRIYYGVAPGDVPFLWESTPGTPKHVYQDHNIPPDLTPPPSHASPAASVDLAVVTKKPYSKTSRRDGGRKSPVCFSGLWKRRGKNRS